MNVMLPERMTVDEFLAWQEQGGFEPMLLPEPPPTALEVANPVIVVDSFAG